MFDFLCCSIKNIKRKKIRTLLTVMGIVIGVASVIVIGTIGDIGKTAVKNELDRPWNRGSCRRCQFTIVQYITSCRGS